MQLHSGDGVNYSALFHIRTLRSSDYGSWFLKRKKIAQKYKKWEENSLYWRAGTVSVWERWKLIFESFLWIEIDEKTKSSNFLTVSVLCKFWPLKRLGSESRLEKPRFFLKTQPSGFFFVFFCFFLFFFVFFLPRRVGFRVFFQFQEYF